MALLIFPCLARNPAAEMVVDLLSPVVLNSSHLLLFDTVGSPVPLLRLSFSPAEPVVWIALLAMSLGVRWDGWWEEFWMVYLCLTGLEFHPRSDCGFVT